VQNLEGKVARAGSTDQAFTLSAHVLYVGLVLAEKDEESAHLARGLLRPPAFLQRADGSASAFVKRTG